ncbi:MAG TPA: TetR/AcrR family transcriptional regulator [Pseudonocardia sp.]|jgi:AcrR family transcriptional regulator|uniref:TetR/AcrR family transcriptional regulator n=1 Tax=Pseudonocardia sp. TaxID=60912 RepID=UPI002ED8D9AF
MDTRTRILEAATKLLAESPSGDVSTRAVCEAAGVAAPALYRQFGDKEGLLSAVVDNAFEKYLASKRAAVPSDDPLHDLRDGWDSHVAFAQDNPTYYRLMHSPAVGTPPPAATEAFRILHERLELLAAAGRLKVSTELAGQMIMTANVGVALLTISQPDIYKDQQLSHRVRDAVHAAVLADPRASEDPSTDDQAETSRTAAGLAALLRRSPAESLSAGEATLLQEWLARLSDTR